MDLEMTTRPPVRLALPGLALVLLVAASYLLSAWMMKGVLAFPLDDAWIHQTYARSLALRAEWSYGPGAPSSGSTAPLWTILLAPGHWFPSPLAPVLWSHGLGIALWCTAIVLGVSLSLHLFRDRVIAGWTALVLAAEWHLGWAALSGMEIPLYISLVLLLMWLFLTRRGSPWLWGFTGGILTLARPEGMLLLGLAGLFWLLDGDKAPRTRVAGAVQMGLGWLLPVGPYLLFNLWVSGLLLPNTFYAKQEEYAILLAAMPVWERVFTVAAQPWIGAQVFFLLALPWLPWRRLPASHYLPLLWALGIVALYALRLPVTYQHGRYLMPTIPVFLIYGTAATVYLLRRVIPLLRRPLAAAFLTAFGLFILLGAQSYGQDVSTIECEMGTAAVWIERNSAPDDLIAAHDIGKLGYVARRPILDFAGLISPETIPIIRDETALLELAIQRDARYLVTFADWYPTMVRDPRLTPVFATACPLTRAAGVEPMTIYEIRP
jgi:hypothetical protein